MHFNNLYGTQPMSDYNLNEQQEQIVQNDCLDALFTISELKYAVYSQTNSRSPNADHLIAEVFKHSLDIIFTFHTSIVQQIIHRRYLPSNLATRYNSSDFQRLFQLKQKYFVESHCIIFYLKFILRC
jgi:hypothetical protein